MVEKIVNVTFNVLKNGHIIHKLTKTTSIIFDQNGTFSLTPYVPKKSEIIGKIIVTVPESVYRNVYALSFNQKAKEAISDGLKIAKEMLR